MLSCRELVCRTRSTGGGHNVFNPRLIKSCLRAAVTSLVCPCSLVPFALGRILYAHVLHSRCRFRSIGPTFPRVGEPVIVDGLLSRHRSVSAGAYLRYRNCLSESITVWRTAPSVSRCLLVRRLGVSLAMRTKRECGPAPIQTGDAMSAASLIAKLRRAQTSQNTYCGNAYRTN